MPPREPNAPAADSGGFALPDTLRRLVTLRWLAIAGQAASIAAAQALAVKLPYAWLWLVVAATVAVNLGSAARVAGGARVTHREVAWQLGIDLAAFSVLILLAGGTENPFWVLYVLHAVLMALLLPARLALGGALLVVASFTAASALEAPLRNAAGVPVSEAVLHAGLWAGFALTVVVTAWYIVRIVADLQAHERLLRETAARALNDEALTRIGTLAAGAAHELGTPLTTIAVVAGEMARSAATPEAERDADILTAQVDACRRALSNLTGAAGHLRAEGGGAATVDRFLASIVARFQAVRPEVPLTARWDGTAPAPEIFADATLQQAILILLNNAADASPHHVEIVGRWDETHLHLAVRDRGPGAEPARLPDFGRTFFTTKAPGMGSGLGLVLTASTVARLGGSVQWTNRTEGGLSAEVALPLASLLVRN
jgi:two-component system, sensor histidine kinase RegB